MLFLHATNDYSTKLEEIVKMKKTVLCLMMMALASMVVNAQDAKLAKSTSQAKASTFAERFEKFVKDVEANDSLTEKTRRSVTLLIRLS